MNNKVSNLRVIVWSKTNQVPMNIESKTPFIVPEKMTILTEGYRKLSWMKKLMLNMDLSDIKTPRKDWDG